MEKYMVVTHSKVYFTNDLHQADNLLNEYLSLGTVGRFAQLYEWIPEDPEKEEPAQYKLQIW